ncbi:ABC transporter ATP-binding protein [Salegentibacter mishustinae]|uniref:ABC transporter ATP-binding protein n=1 Tax=Salegentibacter mishustinae TaxID=270918 RepID=A0A0Q9Z876_9FLAO|nr:ABC transporter ATP-binding protein [Salegentibacter mishustinae]KRG29165.1 ABC transporter ATP-binding protein [Salegentibacter mishustinae]PNW21783.1 ABC transporter ATP-binding protein [Salegentibacter mishustinae]PZX65126.1 ABC-type multidrug transport system fused ATPase/permease subunit [Salegentibacter mishustinae]GGW87164.1 ABC transporter ATP-binding protein [Salegentibacter mishustinae]
MDKLKKIIKNNFQYFFYFYSYLRYRIFIAFGLSFLRGVLDGFGLAMFIPLLKMSSSSTDEMENDGLGNLSFLPEFLNSIGITLNITNTLLIILTFFCFKGFVAFLEGYTRVTYQQLFMREIRLSNIKLLNTFKFSEFVKSDVGKIQNTFSGEVGRVNIAYQSYFKAIEYGVLVLVYVIFAFAANARFAIIVAIGGMLTNFLFKWLFKKTKKLSKTYTKSAHRFQSLLIQHVANFKYLKASGLNFKYGAKLKDNITELEEVQKNLGLVDSTLRALREPLTILVVVIAILIQVRYFNSDIGLIILSLLFLYRSLTFLLALQEHWNRFLGVSGSMDNMSNFTKELKSNKVKNGEIVFEGFEEKINIRNIHFKFGNVSILSGLDLEINKNESIAIVGESGSGKSTLMNVLSGLLIPEKGEVLVDGRSLKELDLISYRKKIGYIAQEAPVFNDSVFNNITFWAEKNEQNMQRFKEAIRKAALHDFVNSLDNKEDEMLGNNGINISGGQKQRLSIARELYKDVDFLFMDEATSALDGETEAAIQSNIDKLKGQYTIIIIAHRLATVKNADKIVVLKKGNIESIGSFKELSQTSEVFKEMIKLQGMTPVT